MLIIISIQLSKICFAL